MMKKMLPQKEYLASLPKKRVASGVIFLDDENRVLIVKPNYLEHWLLPGGVVEENESPLEGAVREVKEELGVEIVTPRMIAVTYKSQRNEITERLHFIFFAGQLQNDVVLKNDELESYQYVPFSELSMYVKSFDAKAVNQMTKAIEEDRAVYIDM